MVIPFHWRQAIVIPIFKHQKPPFLTSSYRPISLTSCLGKLFERIVIYRWSWYLASNHFIPHFQAGFRKGRSTLDHIIALESSIKMCFASSLSTCALFLDISKAYDSVWISGLLAKLARLQIHGRCLKWLKGFLCYRSFCVRIENYLSEFRDLVAGVPQGSILSPILFNVMISDFPNPSPEITTLLYADDVAFFYHARNSASAECIIQPVLDLISAWGLKWRLEFSASK